MIEINLLPPEIIQQRKKRDFIIFVGICVAVAISICYLLYLSLAQSIYPLEQKLEDIKRQISQYQPTLKEIEETKKENAEIMARFDAFRQVVERQSFWPRLLYEIYRALPDTLWLNEIKTSQDGKFVEIEGNSLNETIGVAHFINNLKKSGIFSDIEFIKFSQHKIADKQAMLFRLRCFLGKERPVLEGSAK